MLHQTVYRRPTAIAGVALALVMAVTGIFAPVLAPHDPNAVSSSALFVPPGGNAVDGQSHILGTDHLGRDVLSRIVTSFRINLYIGLLGILLGLLAAWLLVIVRSMRSAALTQNMPRPLLGVPFYGLAILTYIIGFFLSITIAASVGSSLEAAIGCSGVFSALLPMALVYGSVRGDRASSGPVRLAVRRGIALSPIGFSLAFLMGLFIESSLSFLGVGVPPSVPSLGGAVAVGAAHLKTGAWIVVFPLGIVLVAVGAVSAIVIPVGRILSPPAGTALQAQAGTPAGFWIRLVARLIDYFAVMAVLFAIIALLSAPAGTILAIALLTALVWILVTSPGKRALGLHVLRPDGSRVGLRRKSCRSLAGLFLGLDFGLIIAFRKDKRGIHDLICDTVVVRL